MKNMNKKAQGMVALWIIVGLVALIGAGFFFGIGQGGFGVDREDGEIPAQCEIAPSITYSVINAERKGTAISDVTHRIKVNDGAVRFFATANTFQPGDKVQTLTNGSNSFIAVHDDGIVLNRGNNQIDVELFATSTNTFRIFNSDGNAITDDVLGGAINQSSSASPINMQFKIDSTVDESTGALIIVIEASNDTAVDKITLSDLPGIESVAIPDFFSSSGANTATKAFRISAVLDGTTVSGNLQITPEKDLTMGQELAGLIIRITAYPEEAFVDTDGSFKVGIEDDDGTSVALPDWDFDFAIS